MTYNRIPVAFGATKKVTGPEISYQYDVVQKLMIKGLDLPAVYRVDFCNEGDAQTISMTGGADGVPIPDQLLQTGKKIKAYIMLTGTDEGAVETRYEAILPVNSRPAPSDIEPTPAEQQQIDALIEALNDGVERAEDAAEQAEEAAELLTNPSAEATTLEPGSPATAEYDDGVFKFGIPKGDKGDKLTYADLTDADKADLVQGPILEARTAAVQAVNTAGDTQTDRVNQAGTTNVNAVNQAGTTNLNAVNQAGTTQVGNVNDAGTAQVAAVEAEGTEQVGAVRAKGAEVLESIPDDYTELQHHVDAVTIYDTASGAIASFEDGADDLPIKKLVANIEPVQDLHGYANPWPGGGMGNLAYDVLYQGQDRVTWGNVTLSIKDSKWRLVGTALYNGGRLNLRTDPFLLKAGTYNISNDVQIADIILQKASDNSTIVIASINGRTFTLEEDINVFIGVNMTSGITYNADIAVLLNAGSTKGTWTPYSNICPISGHTGAEIQQRGKNLLFDTTIYRTGMQYRIGSNDPLVYPFYLKAGTYTFSNKGTAAYTYWQLEGTSLNNIIHTGASLVGTFTLTEDGYYRFWFYSGVDQAVFEDIMLEVGSTASAYESYQGETYEITFPSEAGTVYGGTLDLVSGKLTVDRAILTKLWSEGAISGQVTDVTRKAFYPSPLANVVDKTKFKSNIGPIRTNSNGVGFWPYAPTQFYVIMPSDTDGNTTIEMCYVLANPVTYQLTPQEIRTLLGTNNVWADTGDIAECEYPADTKLYIQQLTKPTEDDMVANANIAANKFFMIGNALYYSTAAIAAGATIIPGTNCNAVSLADALNTLNA